MMGFAPLRAHFTKVDGRIKLTLTRSGRFVSATMYDTEAEALEAASRKMGRRA